MKIIIGIIILYIIVVVTSSGLMMYIWSAYKGTEHEETWKSSLKLFSIGYLIAGIFIAMIFAVSHFFLFN